MKETHEQIEFGKKTERELDRQTDRHKSRRERNIEKGEREHTFNK